LPKVKKNDRRIHIDVSLMNFILEPILKTEDHAQGQDVPAQPSRDIAAIERDLQFLR